MSLLNYFKRVPQPTNPPLAAPAPKRLLTATDAQSNGHIAEAGSDTKRRRTDAPGAPSAPEKAADSENNGEKAKSAEPPSNGTLDAFAQRVERDEPASFPDDARFPLEKATMRADWYRTFHAEMQQPYFAQIQAFLAKEAAQKRTVFPPDEDRYTFARYPLQQIRVVILGQDPYHNHNQAHGLCFSVRRGVPPPPSLVNIFKELESDLGRDAFKIPSHGCLEAWSRQGVLLLNASLTVRAHTPASHAQIGWHKFTDAIIRHIDRHHRNVVFLLWGSHAQKKAAGVDKKKHLVLQAVHPSPLSAHRGFFGCRHFSKCNAYLQQHNRQPVDWSLGSA